jgi:hypothetical protein
VWLDQGQLAAAERSAMDVAGVIGQQGTAIPAQPAAASMAAHHSTSKGHQLINLS